jgi:hypothetical protein
MINGCSLLEYKIWIILIITIIAIVFLAIFELIKILFFGFL